MLVLIQELYVFSSVDFGTYGEWQTMFFMGGITPHLVKTEFWIRRKASQNTYLEVCGSIGGTYLVGRSTQDPANYARTYETWY